MGEGQIPGNPLFKTTTNKIREKGRGIGVGDVDGAVVVLLVGGFLLLLELSLYGCLRGPGLSRLGLGLVTTIRETVEEI